MSVPTVAIVNGVITALELLDRIQRNGKLSDEDREKSIDAQRELRKLLVGEANAPVGEPDRPEQDSVGEDEPSEATSESSTPVTDPAVLTPDDHDENFPDTSDLGDEEAPHEASTDSE